jgi:DNA anti-recombination protein RmuC
MWGKSCMSEEYANQDLYRADIAALRTELKEELHGVRQDVAVLTKTVEALGQRMEQGFAHMNQRFEDMKQQSNQRFEDMQRQSDQRFAQVERQLAQHDIRLLSLENWMRTTFVTVAVVAIGVASQFVYMLVRFGFKP